MTDNLAAAGRASHVIQQYLTYYQDPGTKIASAASDLLADFFHFFGPEETMNLVEIAAEHYLAETQTNVSAP